MSLSFSFDQGAKPSASAKTSRLKPSEPQRAAMTPVLVSQEEAIELSPTERSARVESLKEEGNTLAEGGFFIKALQKWDEALIHDPPNALLHELRAQVLLEIGEDELALQAASQAVEFSGEWSDAHLTLGRVFLNLGLLNEAKEAMEHALVLINGDSDAHGRPWGENSSAMEIERELDEVSNLITLKAQREEAAAASNAKPEEATEKPVETAES